MTDSLYTSTVMHLMHVFHSYVLWVKSTQQEDLFTSVGGTRPSRPQMCCTPAVNNKRHESVCATRLSGAWRWPARSKKGKTPSALAFRGPSVDSLYMVELKLDVN